jgi:hypothetical protein
LRGSDSTSEKSSEDHRAIMRKEERDVRKNINRLGCSSAEIAESVGLLSSEFRISVNDRENGQRRGNVLGEKLEFMDVALAPQRPRIFVDNISLSGR